MLLDRINASGLTLRLACGGSKQYPRPKFMEDSDAAREGTAAHFVGECLLKDEAVPDTAPNGCAINSEMRDYGADYATLCGGPNVGWTEVRCDWLATSAIEILCKVDRSWYDPDTGTLYVRDYKYGWRLVEPENHPQLIAGAVGIIRKLSSEGTTFPLTLRVNMGIFQPRPYHPAGPLRVWDISLEELIAAHDALVNELENSISDALNTGPHCERCPGAVAGTCPAFLAAVGNSIDVATRGGPMEIPAEALGRELVTLKRAADVLQQRMEWAKDIAKRALKAGGVVKGWALEPQYGHTTWTIDAETLKTKTNIDVMQPPKAVTPAEAKRRGVAEELLTENTKRPYLGDKLTRRDPDAYVRKKLGKPKK